MVLILCVMRMKFIKYVKHTVSCKDKISQVSMRDVLITCSKKIKNLQNDIRKLLSTVCYPFTLPSPTDLYLI